MVNSIEIICPNCEVGTMTKRAVRGRTASAIPGVSVEVPEDFLLPTCSHCLDYSVPESDEAAFGEAVTHQLLAWQRNHITGMVDAIATRHDVTRRRVAAALGITPSYLSNLTSGDKSASVTLLRLLHAFTTQPSEFEHALHGTSLDDYASWNPFANRGGVSYSEDPSAPSVGASVVNLFGHRRPSPEWRSDVPTVGPTKRDVA